MLEIALADNSNLTDLNLEDTSLNQPQLIRAMAAWQLSRLSRIAGNWTQSFLHDNVSALGHRTGILH